MLFDENGEASWRALWNEIPGGTDLTGNILTFNNSRDAFGIAQFILNYENAWKEGVAPGTDLYVNTSDQSRWDEAYELLLAQRACLQAYVMDEIYNKMESGAALLSAYYAGDYFTMVDVNDRLCFTYPKEGTNFFYDAMCVPTCSREPELAQIYMNFLLGGTDANPVVTCLGTFYAENVVAENGHRGHNHPVLFRQLFNAFNHLRQGACKAERNNKIAKLSLRLRN